MECRRNRISGIADLPASTEVNSALRALVPRFGYSGNDPAIFNNSFRNPVMSTLTAERLFFIPTNDGMSGLECELRALIRTGMIHSGEAK